MHFDHCEFNSNNVFKMFYLSFWVNTLCLRYFVFAGFFYVLFDLCCLVIFFLSIFSQNCIVHFLLLGCNSRPTPISNWSTIIFHFYSKSLINTFCLSVCLNVITSRLNLRAQIDKGDNSTQDIIATRSIVRATLSPDVGLMKVPSELNPGILSLCYQVAISAVINHKKNSTTNLNPFRTPNKSCFRAS